MTIKNKIKKYNMDENKDVCPDKDVSNYSSQEIWYKKYQYCLYKCSKCKDLEILKKILWELRKPGR